MRVLPLLLLWCLAFAHVTAAEVAREIAAFRAFFATKEALTADEVEKRFGRPDRYAPLYIRQEEKDATRDTSWWAYKVGAEESVSVQVENSIVYVVMYHKGKMAPEIIREISPIRRQGSESKPAEPARPDNAG